MQIAVMDTAKKHGELITDPAPQRAGLPKPDVMGIRRTPAADETGLRTHEVPMRFIRLRTGFMRAAAP
jgi:hypothetical protein